MQQTAAPKIGMQRSFQEAQCRVSHHASVMAGSMKGYFAAGLQASACHTVIKNCILALLSPSLMLMDAFHNSPPIWHVDLYIKPIPGRVHAQHSQCCEQVSRNTEVASKEGSHMLLSSACGTCVTQQSSNSCLRRSVFYLSLKI